MRLEKSRENKMKVSIVSLFGNFNYGNRLQSYAMQEILRRFGFDTKVIYIETFREKIRNTLKKIFFLKPIKIVFIGRKNKLIKYERQRNFEAFNEQNIKIESYSMIDKIEDADYFVLGSDQVWNPKRYNDVKKRLYLLTFAPPEKKICLAPSFGLSNLPKYWESYFTEELQKFPMLSVREESGKEIIKKLVGKEAEVLIDPTLLLDREEWVNIEKKPKFIDVESNYILNYFLGDMPIEAKEKSKKIAKEMNYEVYNLLEIENPELYVCGPAEFLYLINHATLVQTDSFHACVFSFLYGRPFLVYEREGRDPDMFSRIETLLSLFHLKRKYVNSGLENDIFECDYESGYHSLIAERKKFIDFLKKSMNLK